MLQEHPPTRETVLPPLRSALASRVQVEQAKGFLSEMLGVSVADAFRLMDFGVRFQVPEHSQTGRHRQRIARERANLEQEILVGHGQPIEVLHDVGIARDRNDRRRIIAIGRVEAIAVGVYIACEVHNIAEMI